VVGNKRAVHSSDLELKCVFDESSSDEIVVFTLEALKAALFLVDRVVHVLEIVLNVVADRRTCPGLDLKHERVSVFVDVPAIDLGSQEKIIIGD